MEAFTVVVASLAALSLTVTKVVDFIRNVTDKAGNAPKWVWNLVAFGVGVGFCVGWQINVTADVLKLIPALADQSDRLAGTAGEVLSGIAIGGLAGFWHEVLDALSSVAKRNRATVGLPK